MNWGVIQVVRHLFNHASEEPSRKLGFGIGSFAIRNPVVECSCRVCTPVKSISLGSAWEITTPLPAVYYCRLFLVSKYKDEDNLHFAAHEKR